MSLIDFPASPVPAEIQWALRQPTQVNRSEFTGRRKVTVLAGAPRWRAQVSLPIIIGEAKVLAWRAFLARCQGQAHWFRLGMTEGAQMAAVAVQVDGPGQSGLSLATKGWGAAGLKLGAGRFVTINGQPLQLVADVVADSAGKARLSFLPYVRVSPADSAPVVVDRPYATMAMADDEAGWTVSPGQQYSISFACEEYF